VASPERVDAVERMVAQIPAAQRDDPMRGSPIQFSESEFRVMLRGVGAFGPEPENVAVELSDEEIADFDRFFEELGDESIEVSGTTVRKIYLKNAGRGS